MDQETMKERTEAAERLFPQNIGNCVLNGRPAVSWTSDGDEFTYTRQIPRDGEVEEVTVLVNAANGEEKIIDPEGHMDEVSCGKDDVPPSWTLSPDGAFALYTKDDDLILLNRKTGCATALTHDGCADIEYGCYVDIYTRITTKRSGYVEHPLAVWSPDSRYFVTYRVDWGDTGLLNIIESFSDSDEDLRPKLWQYPCPFATDDDDEIPHYTLMIGDTLRRELYPVEGPDFLYPVFTSPEKSNVAWMEDSKEFYYTWIDRGYKLARLYLVNASDGSSRKILEETTDLFFNLGAFALLDGYGGYLFSNFVTQDRRYAFWQSERSGYAHFYRYRIDADGSTCEGDLFGDDAGELIVQKIIRVDEENKKIYFYCNNAADCSDPLYYQLYVVAFDGSGLKRLTPEDATHTISLGRDCFVDTYSRVDLPPVTVLRRLDGSLVRELEKADISGLLDLGYQIPERFCVTAEDGETTLYGILIRPASFSEDEKYPLIDYVYGGAQLYNVPREFTWDNAQGREMLGGLESFAQVGIAGMILDGRGTPGRGMKIHGFSYHNIHGCDGLVDHVHALDEIAEKFPFIDTHRVGIWGNSAGGYCTVSAMLTYPDTYIAGVASSGNYDQRVYEHSWTERYYGLYDEELYKLGDITKKAGNLKGKLMLAYGAMDDNVTMSQTLRLCDELNRKDKVYDLVVLPRCNHNVSAEPYFMKRKLLFFMDNLLTD